MPCCGRSPPLVAHRLPGSGERVPGRARVHCALSRGLRALPLALQVCRIRTSSRTSGRRAASSRRPVVSVPRVATRRERPALPLLCLCCSCASPVRVSNEIFLVQKSSLNYSDAKGTKGDLRAESLVTSPRSCIVGAQPCRSSGSRSAPEPLRTRWSRCCSPHPM